MKRFEYTGGELPMYNGSVRLRRSAALPVLR